MRENVKINVKKHEMEDKKSAIPKQKTNNSQSVSFPLDRIMFLQRTIGNQVVQRLMGSEAMLAKLRIGTPGDIYEQEADKIALQVMNMPETRELKGATVSSPNRDIAIERECPKCIDVKKEGEKPIQKSPAYATEVTPDLESHLNAMHNAGQPMSNSLRNYFEPRFGYDFSHVRIQTDSRAVMLNSKLDSRAFTTGKDIFFGEGQYEPDSFGGRKLLAHELTHTIQQGASGKMVQADFAVPPTTPAGNIPVLTPQEIQDAITYNQARHTDATEIGLMRDILGIAPAPAVIDADFINAVVRYQAQYGLSPDGRLGHKTADRLAREIIAESEFLGAGNLGSLAPEFNLKTAVQTLITANNSNYADYRTAIQAATMMQQHVALNDQQLLRDLRGQLSWNNWARCIELLGRRAPSGNDMRSDSAVRAALAAAWVASNPAITIWGAHDPDPAVAADPCNPPPAGPPPTAAHEEGGFIYMNLITGDLTTRNVPAGGQAALVLAAPPVVADSIVVGGFHTHPNVGVCWGAPFFSPEDNTWSANNGVPLLMIGAHPAIANTSRHATGNTRAHLAGNRGLPGPAGGLAPQANLRGDFDEL